ncbi:MAG: hypothetical protein CMF59_16690 [Leptospiraceae bacterium]|nr:hypothetical protein [Leptospiraceae bacterium]
MSPVEVKQAEDCEEKRVFMTRMAAKKEAKYLGRNKSRKLSPYLCPVCNCFHLTKKETPK